MTLLSGSMDILSSLVFNVALFRGFAFCVLFVVIWITHGFGDTFLPLGRFQDHGYHVYFLYKRR